MTTVLTDSYVYKNQNTLNNSQEQFAPLIAECTAESRDTSQMLLSQVEACKEPKLDGQEILSLFAEISPFPFGIICLESNQILFKNQTLEHFFCIESCRTLNKIAPDFFANPVVWAELASNLQSGKSINSCAVQLQKLNGKSINSCAVQLQKLNGDTFAAEISAKVVNYEGKLAALFIFMNVDSQQVGNVIKQSIPSYMNAKIPAIALQQADTRLHLMERAIAASSNGMILTDPNQPELAVTGLF